MYVDANYLYVWAMSQKLSVNCFQLKKNVSKFVEGFIKNCDKDSDKGYILEAVAGYPKHLLNLHRYLTFLLEKMKNKKCIKCIIRNNMFYI